MGMTREEFGKVVAVLKTVYGEEQFIKTQYSFDVWYELLKDLSYKDCMTAAQKYMQTEHFAPKPADLRKVIADGKEPVKDYGDAWMDVQLAIRRFGYMREREGLASLDPMTRKAAENIGWMNLCQSTNQDTDRANFRMIYERLSDRQKEINLISPGVRQLMTQMWAREAIGVEVQAPALEGN